MIYTHFCYDRCDAGIECHLLVCWGYFAGGIEIIMDSFHDVCNFLPLLCIVLLPLELAEIGFIGILGIEQLIV